MKNILIHLHPSKRFNRERELLARIQVDNSLDLGWKAEDIWVITNFPWQHNGVKALKIGDDHFCEVMPRSTNTVTVPYLFESGMIDPGVIYWVHDFDACQMTPFQASDLRLENCDTGLTDYGWSHKWNLGSFFFTQSSKDIFDTIKKDVYGLQTEDERALAALTKQGFFTDRIKRLNISYNFGMRHVAHNWGIAEKPLKVLHFHPYYREKGLTPLRVFMYGESDLLIPLMDTRLIKIFQHHGIR